jgi:hypothetical protein
MKKITQRKGVAPAKVIFCPWKRVNRFHLVLELLYGVEVSALHDLHPSGARSAALVPAGAATFSRTLKLTLPAYFPAPDAQVLS